MTNAITILKAAALAACAALIVAQAALATGPTPAAPQAKTQQPATSKSTPDAVAPQVLKGHGGPVKAVAVSPDGKYLLSGSFDYSAIGWQLGDDQKQLFRFDDVEGAINAVAWSARHVFLAGDDGKLRILDRQNWKPVAGLAGHSHKITGVSVSPDGRAAVTASWDRTARVWRLSDANATEVSSRELTGHQGPVNAAVFAADGRQIVTASADGDLRLFDAATGELVRSIYKHGWGLNALATIGSSNLIAFGATDGAVGLVDVASGNVFKKLASHDKPVLALAAATDRVATAGGDGIIRVWNTGTWELIEEYKNPFGPIWALAFSIDGKTLYYGGLDDAVHIWQVTPRKPFEPVASSYPRRFQLETESDDPVEIGRIQFARKCSVCHTLTADDGNRAGPTLYKIFGRRIAALEGYRFSEPLKRLDIVWSPETVSKLFELGPEVFTPGSKMPLQTMKDPAQRAALIAFLKQATEPGDRGSASEAVPPK